MVPPSKEIVRWLSHNRPDVLVASPVNMRFSEEIEYLKAAKKLSIPSVIPVLSWDNLTTKGIFHIIPDYVLVWNCNQESDAMRIHAVPKGRAIITGSPFFDKWFDAQGLLVDREAFCRRIGMDPSSPFVTYLGSSANIATDETWIVKDIHRAIKANSAPEVRGMNLLVRPHPANVKHYAKLSGSGITVWPRQGALPEVQQSQSDFYNSLKHSVAAIGINTTGMIDAVILDRPSLTVLAPAYQKTQLSAEHFKELLAADVLEVLSDSSQVVDKLKELIRGDDRKQAGRQEFVKKFVRPHGLATPAGYMAALAVEGAARGLTPDQMVTHMQNAATG